MPKITLEEQPEFTTFPNDSILELKVEEVNVRDVDGRHGPWQKLEFKFKILGVQSIGDGGNPADYDHRVTGTIWGSVPFKLTDSPENKLRQWAEAIFGMELGIGFELDTDNFLNRTCRGITSTYDKRSKDPRTGLPYKGEQIDSLLRAGGVAPQQQMAAQPVAQPVAQNPWDAQQAARQPQTVPGDPWAEDPPF